MRTCNCGSAPDAKPGEGVTVGVLDTGIDSSHPAFEGKRVFGRLLKNARDEDGSDFSHGTAVASVIAGVEHPDLETDASGVAWGRRPRRLRDTARQQRRDPTGPHSVNGLQSTAEFFADTFTEILAWRDGSRRIDFLNLSLGVQGIIDRYGEEVLREPMKPLVEVMTQADSEDKTVFVWAAGNSHGDECDPALPECVDGKVEAKSVSLLPGLAARFPELKENTLAVVAIREDGGNHRFLQPLRPRGRLLPGGAGRGMSGRPISVRTRAWDGVRGTVGVRGTSFAAPMVTGGPRADEAVLPRPAPQHKPRRAPSGNGGPERRLGRFGDLRPRAPGPRRRHLAGGRTGGRGRFACRWPRSRAATDEPAARRRLRQRSGLIARKSRSRGVRRPGRALLVQFQRPFDAGTGAPSCRSGFGNFNGYPLPVRPTRRRTTSACPCWRPPPRPAAHCRRSI